jgi:hypothetical protein
MPSSRFENILIFGMNINKIKIPGVKVKILNILKIE